LQTGKFHNGKRTTLYMPTSQKSFSFIQYNNCWKRNLYRSPHGSPNSGPLQTDWCQAVLQWQCIHRELLQMSCYDGANKLPVTRMD